MSKWNLEYKCLFEREIAFIQSHLYFFFQRRGTKENLEQNPEMQEETVVPAVPGDEEVVVDNVDSAPISLNNREPEAPKDFVVGPQQLLGLDHAVLQSIDRCRKYNKIFKVCDENIVVYMCKT